jgi:hypothetical protein
VIITITITDIIIFFQTWFFTDTDDPEFQLKTSEYHSSNVNNGERVFQIWRPLRSLALFLCDKTSTLPGGFNHYGHVNVAIVSVGIRDQSASRMNRAIPVRPCTPSLNVK